MNIKLPDSLTKEQADAVMTELDRWLKENEPEPGWYARFMEWFYRLIRSVFN